MSDHKPSNDVAINNAVAINNDGATNNDGAINNAVATNNDGAINTDTTKTAPAVKKTLTLTDLILMGLANIVGAGIFVIIGKSIKYGGKQTLYALLIVAAISLIMGFCYIEIYNRFKSSIVEYLTVKNTMGDTAGQVMIYLTYFFAIFSGVTIVISISKYLSSLRILFIK